MSQENADEKPSSDNESTDEEIEPKLKYVRLLNDLQNVLQKETASCMAVHAKLICLGTNWGRLHLFDHQGNKITTPNSLKPHTVSVNHISIHWSGDFIATCSSDGNIHITDLCLANNSYTIQTGREIHCVALDPNSSTKNTAQNAKPGNRLVSGEADLLLLHERSVSVLGMTKVKSVVLCQAESCVRGVSWRNQFIAWSTEVGVRVYDVKERRSLGLIKWEEPLVIGIRTLDTPVEERSESGTNLKHYKDIETSISSKQDSAERIRSFGNESLPSDEKYEFNCGLRNGNMNNDTKNTPTHDSPTYATQAALNIATPQPPPALSQFRCCLRWADDRTLLIGWADTVRVCIIRKRGVAATLTHLQEQLPLPDYLVDPVSTFRTEFFISGVAALDERQIVVLGAPREENYWTGCEGELGGNDSELEELKRKGSDECIRKIAKDDKVLMDSSTISKYDDDCDSNINRNSNRDFIRANPDDTITRTDNFQTEPYKPDAFKKSKPTKSKRNGKNPRPQLHILEYHDCEYSEVCTDSLSLRGYGFYECWDYQLEMLPEEQRFFVIAPKDIVIASPCDLEDKVQWLITHERFEQALSCVENGRAGKWDKVRVGIIYLDRLLAEGEFETAGKLCLRIFEKDDKLWHEHVYKFARSGHLHTISPYLPLNLGPHIYEMTLYECLQSSPRHFLHLIKNWHQPQLYNTAAIINSLLEQLLVTEPNKSSILLESLALLYARQGQYSKSLSMYLKLKDPEVFKMLRQNQLYDNILEIIIPLMELDKAKTIELLMNDRKRVKVEKVVDALQGKDEFLFAFLECLDRVDSKECAQFHGRLVKLCAVFGRDRLMALLRKSDQYPIQEALDICRSLQYFPETVYLLGRIGDTREALSLIITRLSDIKYALEFCREHNDPDLWADLLNNSLNNPNYIAYLLPRVNDNVDTRALIHKIPENIKIPGLKNSLVAMLKVGYIATVIQAGCKKILANDCFRLHEKLVRSRNRGILVTIGESVCSACLGRILHENSSSLVTYNCKHIFHQECLQDTRNYCAICCSHNVPKM